MTLFGMAIDDKVVQPLKQLLPNDVTLVGIITDDRLLQP